MKMFKTYILMKCPNGTNSLPQSTSVSDCVANGLYVNRRISVVPKWYNDSTTEPSLMGHLKNSSDFWELGGADDSVEGGVESYTVGTISLDALDVLMVTLDFTQLESNLTYGEHYRIAVYVDCKPCPPSYVCDYRVDPPMCFSPNADEQSNNYLNCLSTNKLRQYLLRRKKECTENKQKHFR